MEKILNGTNAAAQIKERIRIIGQKYHTAPTLAVVLVGDNPASQIYVRGKEKDCGECGFNSKVLRLPADTTEGELLATIQGLADDPDVDGILVQLPLPKHIDQKKIIDAIPSAKDVDCFTEQNVGRLIIGSPLFAPCTPAGIIKLLEMYQVPMAGHRMVVVGRSNIVGKPMALLGLTRDMTVTVCHSKTKDLLSFTRQADILVSAVGKPGFIREGMVKPGTVVVDVGMNRDENGKLCGDCEPSVYEKAAAYTPVPGGVGPMTRAMLMVNTARAAGLPV